MHDSPGAMLAVFLQLVPERSDMNIKRVFGVVLTVLGIAGLIYFAVLFMESTGAARQIKSLIVYGLLGAIFFFTGINLIKTTHDDTRSPVRDKFDDTQTRHLGRTNI